MISVIVPIYNVECYLRDCIDSILNQTYKDLEIILVNDGSTDNGGQICEEYKKKDSRVVVVTKENGGISDARNVGLDIAKGEYIGFVDSDDMIHPRMYEILLGALVDANAEFSTCGHCLFLDGNEIQFEALLEDTYQFDRVEDKEQYVHNFLRGDFVHYVWRSLYKTELLKTLRFQKGKRMEDIMFCGELSSIMSKRVVVKEKLYYYRIRNTSIMHGNPCIYLEHIDAMEFCLENFKRNEDVAFVQKYAEFIMSHILTHRVETRVCNICNAEVDKECLRRFRMLYRQYGSGRKSHLLAMYLPALYNILKKPKVRRHLVQAKKSGVPVNI